MSDSPQRASYDGSRRRSSNGALFTNLQSYKRETPAYQARRQSLNEQSAQKPGIIGSMFNNVFKAPPQQK